MSRPSKTLDIRALPGTHSTAAYRNGGLFPILALAPNGAVVAAVRGGAGHLGLEGRVEVLRSPDMGRTWSPPAVVADSERDDRDYAFGASATGALILAYHRTAQYDADGVWRLAPFDPAGDDRIDIQVTRSLDGGLTWEPPIPLTAQGLRAGNPFGKIVPLSDGSLAMSIYSHPNPAIVGDRQSEVSDGADCSYLVHSDDDGRTWHSPSLIATRMNETGLLALPDGGLLAVVRSVAPEQALHVTRSTDRGQTWSTPIRLTEARQHPADLIRLSDGSILLTYGNRTPPYQIEGRISRDDGRSWLDILLTFSGPLYGYDLPSDRTTDLGYPSTVVRHGHGVTMYYYNPSVRRAWRTDTAAQHRFYRADDYAAIAVSWSEQALLAALDTVS